jgi:transcriptional antiterminator NusG
MSQDETQHDPAAPSDHEDEAAAEPTNGHPFGDETQADLGLPEPEEVPAPEDTRDVVEPASEEPAATVDEMSFAETPEGDLAARVDEPAHEEPAAEETPVEEPVAESPSEEPPAEVVAAEESDLQAPAEEPVETPADEPAVEEPAFEEPAPAFETPVPEPAYAATPELAAAVDEAFADVAEEEEEELIEWQPGEWFVVHTYAGYENKVKTNLESRIVSMNMEEKIYEVVIPVEDVMEVKSGKKQVVQRKVFPGYLLVRMDLDDDSWYVVRNTPGVTGFVGSGTKPIPLSEKEVDRVLQRKGPEERPKPRLEYSSGDNVRVVTGPFANFQGIISEIDVDRSKLKVLVNIFGRETPVELGFDQVAKV